MSKQTQTRKKLKGKTILLGISGSIAAYRACDLTRDLKAEGADVICLMTKAAREFIAPLTFQSLSGNPVYADPFVFTGEWNVLHTSLAERANLVLIVPATADIIARLAAGFADDMVTSVVLASRAPVLIAPAMNDNMYLHPATQENIKKLKSLNYRFVDPIVGKLACGKTAVGHIAGNASILERVFSVLHA